MNAFPDDKCKSWKELGDCVANKVWMSQNCKKACGVCDSNNDSTGSRFSTHCFLYLLQKGSKTLLVSLNLIGHCRKINVKNYKKMTDIFLQ